MAQTEEETYNEIYLNNKKNPKEYGLFGKIGLRTTQDWVFAFFYFSYIFFCITLIVYLLPQSKNRLQTILTLVFTFIVLGFITTALLVIYA